MWRMRKWERKYKYTEKDAAKDTDSRAPLIIVESDLKTRRTERRNRSVHGVHEDFEHRPTKYSGRATN